MSFPVIITSAAYVNSELAAEYGRLPPAFLPYGHSRLFQSQINRLAPHASPIFLTIPESFDIRESDSDWLSRAEVTLIRIPDGLSLGNSILYALVIADLSGPVGVLHGDTLVQVSDWQALDIIGTALRPDSYDWDMVDHDREINETSLSFTKEGDSVLCGWFVFSCARSLVRSLTEKLGHFISALSGYDERIPLRSVPVLEWLDFGHLQTFYHARSTAATARSFNSITIEKHTVFKRGQKLEKILAEAAWFNNLPQGLRLFTPAFLGKEKNGYRLAYEHSANLHELHMFSCLSAQSWRRIATACFEFMSACHNQGQNGSVPYRELQADIADKSAQRLDKWSRAADVCLDREWIVNNQRVPSVNRISASCIGIIGRASPIPGIMHGDLCFPNIFYDFRQRLVKVIDPRGGVRDGENSIHGDLRYDLAKLNHSLCGYDAILAEQYKLSTSNHNITFGLPDLSSTRFFQQAARDLDIDGQKVHDDAIMAITIHLFLSMLPLHDDRPDRQRAFFSNALRLYSERFAG